MTTARRISSTTIGIVIPAFWSGSYFDSLIGMSDTAKKLGVNLLCFQGSYFHEPYSKEKSSQIDDSGNIIFDLIQLDSIDGMIIISGALKSHLIKIELIKNCSKFESLPIIHVGSKIDNIANFLVDNKTGLRELLIHLIKHHRYNKFAFIRGPEESVDAEIRLETYINVLTENGIPIPPGSISRPGSWLTGWGADATQEILHSNKDTEVIVCASDNLALGCYQELKKQNISIPDQIAVVGFDDNIFSESIIPPLSTVELCLTLRCKEALKLILEHLNGPPLPDEILFPTKAIIRQSCGCPPDGIKAMTALDNSKISEFCKQQPDFIAAENRLIAEILDLLHQTESSKFHQIVTFFVKSFLTQIKDLSTGSFLPDFSEILHRLIAEHEDISQWQWILNHLTKTLPELITEQHYASAYQLIIKARIIINEIAEQEHKLYLMQIEERNATINSLNYNFSKVDTIEKIVDIIAEELPRLGVPSCYLSLYVDTDNSLDNSRLILAYDENGRIALPPEGIVYSSKKLLPDSIFVPGFNTSLIIEPLYYNKQQIGFTLFGIGSIERSFYELFSSQLSTVLWSALLLSKDQKAEAALKEQTAELEKSNAELEKWTRELEEAYKQLQTNQEKLLITEKMASLGRLTAGITHEMNTPLATLRASLSELQKLGTEYLNSISDPSVTAQDHFEIVDEMSRSMNLADTAAERAASFIRSIKAQTRDVKNEPARLFDIVELIDSVIMFLGHSIKHCNCKVLKSSSHKKIEMFGLPTKMTQVFTNLISNSLDALDKNGENAITISIDKVSDALLIVKLSDNGCGIAEENLSRIFEPMFSTKSFGHGTGLGLSIVHDIISGEFGGSINAESTAGKGTTMTLQFNLEQNRAQQKKYA